MPCYYRFCLPSLSILLISTLCTTTIGQNVAPPKTRQERVAEEERIFRKYSPHTYQLLRSKPIEFEGEKDELRRLHIKQYNDSVILCGMCLEEMKAPRRPGQRLTVDAIANVNLLIVVVNRLVDARLNLAATRKQRNEALQQFIGLYKEQETNLAAWNSDGVDDREIPRQRPQSLDEVLLRCERRNLEIQLLKENQRSKRD